MADHKLLIGDLLGGMIVHHQGNWAESDRVTDPQGRQLALVSEAVAAGYGISGAVDTYAELPDPTGLPANSLYIVRQDTGAPGGNGLYRVEGDPAGWVFLDGLNLQQASEVPYDNGTSGLTATTAQAAIDEVAGQQALTPGDGLEDGGAGAMNVVIDDTTIGIAADAVAGVQVAFDGDFATLDGNYAESGTYDGKPTYVRDEGGASEMWIWFDGGAGGWFFTTTVGDPAGPGTFSDMGEESPMVATWYDPANWPTTITGTVTATTASAGGLYVKDAPAANASYTDGSDNGSGATAWDGTAPANVAAAIERLAGKLALHLGIAI